MHYLQKLLSYIYPVTIKKTSSQTNPVLELRIENGKYVLNSANANYSFAGLHKVFQHAFKKVMIGERGIKNILLLGLGTGSIPQILFEDYKLNCLITAIEIDEKVLEFGKKYFNIQRFANLDIICADAFEFVQQCYTKFDLIVVDVFIDNRVPVQFESEKFLSSLKKLMNNVSLLLFNKIVTDKMMNPTFDKLKSNMNEVFNEYKIINVKGNVVFVVETPNAKM